MLSTLGFMLFQDTSQELPPGAGAAAAGLGIGVMLVCAVIGLLLVATMWKIFVKAGRPGWYSLIPIFNVWVLFEIAGKPGWWCLIPIFNAIMLIVIPFEIARKFGKTAGFGVGLLLLGIVFYPILAFGDAQYNANA